VDTDRFAQSAASATGEDGGYFLVVSRLIPYKRVDLAVKAFTALGLPLIIAGDGRDREKLQAMAGPNISFLGRVADADLPGLVARCRAFVFPGYEDFGIAPVEAQAAGRPVIAYAAGGALDTVIDGVTGVFFREPTAESLADAVGRFNPDDFDADRLRQHALQFDKRIFQRRLMALIAPQGQTQDVWNSVPSGPS
jgi:glycosyltransferase involved in cell wall biosynthesis